MAGLITALALLSAPARAQLNDGEEEVLWDPGAETAAAPSPLESSRTELRVVLHSRFGVDTYWEDDLEDVIEATQIALFEVTHHRTENLRFAVGLRGRHVAARRRGEDGDAHYELDAVPTAGYVDGTLVPGMYLRAGYQVVTLGRFDVFSAANVLAVQDLRSGPTAVPDALHVAQPALRLDVDRGSGFAFQAVYVPFFQPHLVTLYGTDYALLAPIDREPASLGRAVAPVNRSALEQASTGVFSAFTPEPDLEEPQGALRATYRAGAGEVSLTTATALERLPVIVIDPARTERPVSIDYPRFAVVSVDGVADAGPFQLGLEVAYLHDRSLFTEAVDDDPIGPSVGLGPVSITDVGPLDFALSEQTRVAHVAARAELVEGAEWIALVEGFFLLCARRARAPQAGVGSGSKRDDSCAERRVSFAGAQKTLRSSSSSARSESRDRRSAWPRAPSWSSRTRSRSSSAPSSWRATACPS